MKHQWFKKHLESPRTCWSSQAGRELEKGGPVGFVQPSWSIYIYMLLGEINKHQSSLGEINTKSKSINVCCIFIVSPLSIAPTIGQEAPPRSARWCVWARKASPDSDGPKGQLMKKITVMKLVGGWATCPKKFGPQPSGPSIILESRLGCVIIWNHHPFACIQKNEASAFLWNSFMAVAEGLPIFHDIICLFIGVWNAVPTQFQPF